MRQPRPHDPHQHRPVEVHLFAVFRARVRVVREGGPDGSAQQHVEGAPCRVGKRESAQAAEVGEHAPWPRPTGIARSRASAPQPAHLRRVRRGSGGGQEGVRRGSIGQV
eukprot:1186458-Prorocentrum_minimum.AAC.1